MIGGVKREPEKSILQMLNKLTFGDAIQNGLYYGNTNRFWRRIMNSNSEPKDIIPKEFIT